MNKKKSEEQEASLLKKKDKKDKKIISSLNDKNNFVPQGTYPEAVPFEENALSLKDDEPQLELVMENDDEENFLQKEKDYPAIDVSIKELMDNAPVLQLPNEVEETFKEVIEEPVFKKTEEISEAKQAKKRKKEKSHRRDTYPPQNVQGEVLVEKPVQVKRVGGITLAISLIVVGVGMLAYVLMPNFDTKWLESIAPITLIAFGIEILVITACHNDKKIRYNVLSVLLMVLLLLCSVAMMIVPKRIENERMYDRTASRLSAEYESAAYNLLKDSSQNISTVSAYIRPSEDLLAGNVALKDVDGRAYVQVNVIMQERYNSKDEFAKDCSIILNELNKSANLPRIDYFTFGDAVSGMDYQYKKDVKEYYLRLTGEFQISSNELIAYVQEAYYDEEGISYTSEDEYLKNLLEGQNDMEIEAGDYR